MVMVICHLPTSRGPLARAGGTGQNAHDSNSKVAVNFGCRPPSVGISLSYFRFPVNENTHVSRPVGVVSSSTSKKTDIVPLIVFGSLKEPRMMTDPQGPLESGHHSSNAVLRLLPLTRHTPSGLTLAPTSSRSTMPVLKSPSWVNTISRSGKPSVLPFRETVWPLMGSDFTIHSPASVNESLCCGVLRRDVAVVNRTATTKTRPNENLAFILTVLFQ